MNKTLYTWQIIKSDSKYNKEAAIFDNGKMVAICPLDMVCGVLLKMVGGFPSRLLR